jgi:ATP-dependent RNA helicase DeaD
VHRVGRVGRAGREGWAITLVEPREQRTLKTIERVAKAKIAIAELPTTAVLRSRALERTGEALRRALAEGGSEEFRTLIDGLTSDFDLVDIAAVAVKQLHEASSTRDHEEIPEQTFEPRSRHRSDRDRPGNDRPGRDRPGRDRPGRERGGERAFERKSPGRNGYERRNSQPDSRSNGHMERIYINLGRSAGIRPNDLVGAIANESGLSGRKIGGIDIADGFSIVEVPASSTNEVLRSLRNTTIRGKRVNARKDRYSD